MSAGGRCEAAVTIRTRECGELQNGVVSYRTVRYAKKGSLQELCLGQQICMEMKHGA